MQRGGKNRSSQREAHTQGWDLEEAAKEGSIQSGGKRKQKMTIKRHTGRTVRTCLGIKENPRVAARGRWVRKGRLWN